MLDLSARVHYKAHFDIVRETDTLDLLRDVIVKTLSDWLKRKHGEDVRSWNWAKFAKYGNFDTDNHKLIASTTSFNEGNSRYWACKIDEFEGAPEEDSISILKKAPRTWTTEVGFEQTEAGRATISYVCYYTDKAGFVGIIDETPKRTTPGFVRDLLYCAKKPFHCAIGKNNLSPIQIKLEIGEADHFADLIKDPERKVPLILVIPLDANVDEAFRFPARELARNVMGNALVYEAVGPDTKEELTYLIDRSYWCMPGQIRIYWPEGNNVARRNRYLPEEVIRKMGSDAVIDLFRRVLAQDIRYYKSKEMFRMDDCDELYRQSRVRQLHSQYQELRSQYQAARESIAKEKEIGKETREQFKLANELFELADEENKALQTDLSKVKDELWKVRTYNEQLLSEQEHARSIENSLRSIRNCSTLPSTAKDIAQYFRQVFSDTLDFSERGIRSLDRCVTRPALLWECFFAMATKLIELYRSNTPEIEKKFQEETGWDMARGEGKNTRNDRECMKLREDHYQGRKISIEPHVRRGNKDNSPDCVRVYFCYDKISNRIVIGHVGNHLPNYTSHKV